MLIYYFNRLTSHGDLDEPEGGQALGGQPYGEASRSVNDGDGKYLLKLTNFLFTCLQLIT